MPSQSSTELVPTELSELRGTVQTVELNRISLQDSRPTGLRSRSQRKIRNGWVYDGGRTEFFDFHPSRPSGYDHGSHDRVAAPGVPSTNQIDRGDPQHDVSISEEKRGLH